MPDFRYLIVGGGMSADAACRGIRAHDADGSIGLLGAEPDPPYSRPPLSKALWQGKDEASIWRGTDALGVDLHLDTAIELVDREARTAIALGGERFGYERLLFATGGRPRRLRGGASDDVVYFRTLADYHRLRDAARPDARVAVVGGGFIGSELAAALNRAGCQVTIVFPEAGIGARIFPGPLAAAIDAYYAERGVEVRSGVSVEAVERDGEGLAVVLAGGERLVTDTVVAGLGITPNAELASAAGLEVDDGIVVDGFGRADDGGELFACGDVARFPSALLGRPMRVEHEDHANSHGFAVGANMAGAETPYEHQPFFYSDLFDVGYEAVGETDPRMDTVAQLGEVGDPGVVAYLDGAERPRGFLLWNIFGKVDTATALIASGEPLSETSLRELLG